MLPSNGLVRYNGPLDPRTARAVTTETEWTEPLRVLLAQILVLVSCNDHVPNHIDESSLAFDREISLTRDLGR